MKFTSSVLSVLFASAYAKQFDLSSDFPADSEMAKSLLKRATVIEHSRHLENNNNQNSFLATYSIKYLSCSSLVQVSNEGAEQVGGLYNQHLVRFALCPSDSCSSCTGGGEYVVNMMDFVDAYTEAKLTAAEQACEDAREACYCENDYNYQDEATCEAACYSNAGLDCSQYEGQDNDYFDVQRYLECGELKNENKNNNNQQNYYQNNANGYYGSYYVGAYCSPSDGKSILMGVFYDQGCVNKADASIFSDMNYGMELPYSKSSMVKTECLACAVTNNNNNNNGNNGYELSELCTGTYEAAAKCETNMNTQYKDTSGCDYIHNILPRLDSASRAIGGYGGRSSSGGRAGAALAWVFAATTILFGAYAYFLYRKIKRGSVNLSAQEGAMA